MSRFKKSFCAKTFNCRAQSEHKENTKDRTMNASRLRYSDERPNAMIELLLSSVSQKLFSFEQFSHSQGFVEIFQFSSHR